MPRFEAVCDCCMEPQFLWRPELETRDCPICGVGRLLGPWPLKPRFESASDWAEISFPHFHEETLPEGD